MNKGLNKTIVVFHISAVLYFLIALLFLLFAPYLVSSLILLLLIGFGIFVEVIVSELKKGKYWAWVAGIIISALWIPSLFIIQGIIGLIGLLDKNTIKSFKKK